VSAAGPGDRLAWDAFVAAHPEASAYHDYRWRGILDQAFGVPSWYLLARNGSGEVGGVLPLVRLRSLLFGDFLVSMPYLNYGGVLAADPAADAALVGEAVTLARQLGVGHVELRETAPRGAGWPARTDKVAMVLDLAGDAEAQFAALGAKLRSQVRRPEREGARVAAGHRELLPDFYRVFARNMRDLGTPVYWPGFFRAILAGLGDAAELVVVYVGAEPAAAGFLVHYRDRTEIPWASSLREWNRIGVNMQLYWSVLKSAIGRGSRQFDFGRSTVDAGTYRFKAQWGAKPRPLYWHYWLPDGRPLPGLNPANPKYALAIRAWQRLPLWLANVVGPPIVRRLP
jgi:FemAB-related protein (PEP-CTERM system-associated)